MSLTKQCEIYSLDLEIISLCYSKRPEDAALEYYKAYGYIGSSNEGKMILTVLKALMLDKLAEHNIFEDRSDACCRYIEAQFEILSNKIEEIINSIKSTKREKFIDNFNEIISHSFIGNMSLDVAIALYDAIDTDTFINLAKKFNEDPYMLRRGWPDLTLVKGKEVKFVEVKTTDKLHNSQLETIPEIREVLPYKFSVLKVLKLK